MSIIGKLNKFRLSGCSKLFYLVSVVCLSLLITSNAHTQQHNIDLNFNENDVNSGFATLEPFSSVINLKRTNNQIEGDFCAVNDQKESCDEKIEQATGLPSFRTILFIGTIVSIIFSFVGVLPSFFIHTDDQEKKFRNSVLFKLLLSFAAGSLLSQAFLCLLPESNSTKEVTVNNGLITIGFLFIYIIIDKLTGLIPNAHAIGTMNLVANFFENSAHATSVVGAFKSSFLFGFAALFATLVHIIPHEFADFALLLRDGYTRNVAIVAQIITSFAGSIIATFSLILSTNMEKAQYYATNGSLEIDHHHSSSVILCFTTAGFLYIALVGIIPEMIEEEDKKISLLQLLAFCVGVGLIYGILIVESILPSFFV